MGGRLQPLAKLARNPSLRRSGIGFALFNAAEYGEWIAVLVYAYAHGGASASGLVAFAQLVPCVVLAPLMATFVDRYQAGRVLVAGFAAQAAGMGLLAAALLTGAPPLVVYAFAVIAAPTFNLTRPTVNVLLPLAVRTPDELTAGNAAMGWIESAGVVAGPLAASLVVALSGAGAVVALFAISMLFAAWIAWPLTKSLPAADLSGESSGFGEAFEGFRLLLREPPTATLVGVLTSQALFFGAMDVLFVVLAIDELGMGDSGVGILNAAFGAGDLLAVVVTLGLVGRRRLGPAMIAAALCTGAAVALIGAWPNVALALVLLAVPTSAAASSTCRAARSFSARGRHGCWAGSSECSRASTCWVSRSDRYSSPCSSGWAARRRPSSASPASCRCSRSSSSRRSSVPTPAQRCRSSRSGCCARCRSSGCSHRPGWRRWPGRWSRSRRVPVTC
jgi:MFS family permease